jgi:hypothetical protein
MSELRPTCPAKAFQIKHIQFKPVTSVTASAAMRAYDRVHQHNSS